MGLMEGTGWSGEEKKYACDGKYFVSDEVCGDCNYTNEDDCNIVKQEKILERVRQRKNKFTIPDIK